MEKNIRDWIHVDDHSNAILSLMNKEKITIGTILVQRKRINKLTISE